MLARWVGCLARGDDRDGDRTSLAPDPDGSWPLQDARQRRDQRDAAQLLATLAADDAPGEDLRSLALSLADSALTSDGTPCSAHLAEHEHPVTSTPTPATVDEPDHQSPTADQIIGALQDTQHATPPDRPPAGDGGRDLAPDWAQRRAPAARRRRLRPRAGWLTAGMVTVVSAVVLTLTVASGPGRRTARRAGRQSQPAAVATALPASRLTTAAASIILAALHATDRTPTPRRGQRHHPVRARPSSPRGSTRHRLSEHARENISTATPPSTTIAHPTVTTPAPVAASGSGSLSTSGGSSTAGSSGASPPPATTAPRTTSSQRSQTPSKATLRSLIDGAGRCTC